MTGKHSCKNKRNFPYASTVLIVIVLEPFVCCQVKGSCVKKLHIVCIVLLKKHWFELFVNLDHFFSTLAANFLSDFFMCTEFIYLFTFVFILQLHCPNGISSMGNSDCFPKGKPAATVMLSNLLCMLGVLVSP